jgi:hypothetical protein
MSAAALRRALFALAVLLVVWGGVALIRRSTSDAPVALALPKLNAADIDRITITSPGDTIALASTASGWQVNGHAAAANAVNELIAALSDSANASELVARSAASHSRMAVDSVGGRRVRFFKGDRVLADVIVGGHGTSYQTSYVRRAADDDVYLFRGQLPTLVGKKLDGWRDRRIAAVAADSVAIVDVTRGKQHWTLARADGGWRLGSAPADSGAAARLLQAMADVSALGFASDAQADSLDFAHPTRALTVLSAAHDTLLHLLFDSAASGNWVRRSSGGPVYQLDFWRINQLTPADSTLRKK